MMEWKLRRRYRSQCRAHAGALLIVVTFTAYGCNAVMLKSGLGAAVRTATEMITDNNSQLTQEQKDALLTVNDVTEAVVPLPASEMPDTMGVVLEAPSRDPILTGDPDVDRIAESASRLAASAVDMAKRCDDAACDIRACCRAHAARQGMQELASNDELAASYLAQHAEELSAQEGGQLVYSVGNILGAGIAVSEIRRSASDLYRAIAGLGEKSDWHGKAAPELIGIGRSLHRSGEQVAYVISGQDLSRVVRTAAVYRGLAAYRDR